MLTNAAVLLSLPRVMETVSPSPSSTAPAAGMLVGGRYRLGTTLGAGAMGVVYAATDERLGREVAIKVIRGNHLKDGAALARFEREAVLTGKLGHPNIVGVTDLGRTDEGHPFVVMERLEGRTLEARILEARTRNTPVPVEEAVAIHVQLLDALACAHDAGVLHRDIKPANIFLSSLATGVVLVKLLDFGIAAPLSGGQKLTVDGSVIGSPVYLAPERFRGKPAQVESDLYAVGISLYETLVGSVPFDSLPGKPIHERVFNERPMAIDGLRSDVPPALARLVERALEKLADQRFPSARAMREALLAMGPTRDLGPGVAISGGVNAGEARGRGGTVLGVSDPSAPAPSRAVPAPAADVLRTVPVRRPISPVSTVAAAASAVVPASPSKSRTPLLVGVSVVIVVASVALGAFAGLRAGQGAPPAASGGAASGGAASGGAASGGAASGGAGGTPLGATPAIEAPVPPVSAPTVVAPAVVPVPTETALPIGVDPPPPVAGEIAAGEIAPSTPTASAHPHAGAHRPPNPRPPVVEPPPPPPPEPAVEPTEPPPRSHMGADGLIHPNW